MKGSRIWAATRKGVFTIDRSGKGWRISSVSFLADNASMVFPDSRDRSVYVALGHGHFGCKLHRSTDGGKNWQAITSPQYPPYPEGRPQDVNPFSGKVTPWNLELVWALEAGGMDQPGTIWCGSVPGGLFRSNDSGQSWELNRPLWDDPRRARWFGGGLDYAGVHSISVHPKDSNNITLAVSCGGVWNTLDGGATWLQLGKGLRSDYLPPDQAYQPETQDVHRLVHCAANPNAMWIQHHNGIFASTDAGHSWREMMDVKPSAFGFAVAVHPADGKTAWFVPGVKDEKRIPPNGKVVVTRTRDGGESFESLGKGLPDEHAYDLVFRHSLDVDSTGNTLAFGSTTGSLWVSENQGDSWQTISTNLPPVYCVRFEK